MNVMIMMMMVKMKKVITINGNGDSVNKYDDVKQNLQRIYTQCLVWLNAGSRGTLACDEKR
jgi:hypothetical protein